MFVMNINLFFCFSFARGLSIKNHGSIISAFVIAHVFVYTILLINCNLSDKSYGVVSVFR